MTMFDLLQALISNPGAAQGQDEGPGPIPPAPPAAIAALPPEPDQGPGPIPPAPPAAIAALPPEPMKAPAKEPEPPPAPTPVRPGQLYTEDGQPAAKPQRSLARLLLERDPDAWMKPIPTEEEARALLAQKPDPINPAPIDSGMPGMEVLNYGATELDAPGQFSRPPPAPRVPGRPQFEDLNKLADAEENGYRERALRKAMFFGANTAIGQRSMEQFKYFDGLRQNRQMKAFDYDANVALRQFDKDLQRRNNFDMLQSNEIQNRTRTLANIRGKQADLLFQNYLKNKELDLQFKQGQNESNQKELLAVEKFRAEYMDWFSDQGQKSLDEVAMGKNALANINTMTTSVFGGNIEGFEERVAFNMYSIMGEQQRLKLYGATKALAASLKHMYQDANGRFTTAEAKTLIESIPDPTKGADFEVWYKWITNTSDLIRDRMNTRYTALNNRAKWADSTFGNDSGLGDTIRNLAADSVVLSNQIETHLDSYKTNDLNRPPLATSRGMYEAFGLEPRDPGFGQRLIGMGDLGPTEPPINLTAPEPEEPNYMNTPFGTF